MRYIVLGASAAGVNGAKEIRRLDKEAEIILISKDGPIYSRCILHHYLEGGREVEDLNFVEKDFAKKYQITHIGQVSCTQIDAMGKKVILSHGENLTYDKLLIATGASTFMVPIPGLDKAENAIGFRNLEDVQNLKLLVPSAKHICVVGAGLVGMDVVVGLLGLGKKVTLIESKPHLLSQQLDAKAALAYQDALQKNNVEQYYNTLLQSLVLQDNKIMGLVLNNGRTIECDLLIVAAGVVANVAFLKGSGIKTDRLGLVVDACGQTSDPHIYGAGDVTGKSPIWPLAVKEGIIAGSNMVGVQRELTDFFASKATMNFFGIPSLSLGVCEPSDETYEVVIEEKGDDYKKIIYKDGKIYGAIIQGDLSYAGVLTQLIAHKIDISKVKKPLLKIDYSDFFHVDETFEFFYE